MKTGGETEICCSLVWQHHCLWWKGGRKDGVRTERNGVHWPVSNIISAFPLFRNLSPAFSLVCPPRLLFNFPSCVCYSQLFAFRHRLSLIHLLFYLRTNPRFVVLSFSNMWYFTFYWLSFYSSSCHFLHLLLVPHFITTEQCPSSLQGLAGLNIHMGHGGTSLPVSFNLEIPVSIAKLSGLPTVTGKMT